jgi:ferredoxin
MSSIGKPVLRVTADRSRCCGYGLCAQMCPEVYQLDADGLVVLVADTVPEGLEEAAREGAAACPAEALAVEEVVG